MGPNKLNVDTLFQKWRELTEADLKYQYFWVYVYLKIVPEGEREDTVDRIRLLGRGSL